MGSEVTTQAVRLALSIHEMEARIASMNIANAYRPAAQRVGMDTARLRATLQEVAAADSGTDETVLRSLLDSAQASIGQSVDTGGAINIDDEVARMSIAVTRYQVLADALNRQLGLMRLAISGRGGA